MQLNTNLLKPSTLAAIVADLVEDFDPTTTDTVMELVSALEICVGNDYSVEYLADAGVTFEQMDEVYFYADPGAAEAIAQAEAERIAARNANARLRCKQANANVSNWFNSLT